MEYREKLKEIDPNLLVYIDEMGCDNKLSILRGWTLIGEPSYGEVLAYQTQRRSIIAGYGYADKKIIAPLEYSGYTNTDIFQGCPIKINLFFLMIYLILFILF